MQEFASQFLLPLVVASVLGGVVGWERESRRKPAGFRTHMLVSLGAAAFVLVGLHLIHSAEYGDHVAADPLRVISGVAVGIGFLGAGSIIQRRGAVKGLTTASATWIVGAVGTAAGARLYDLATATAIIGFIVLRLLQPLDRYAGDEEEDQE